MNTPYTEMVERFTEFFDSHYDGAIDDLAQRYPDRQRSLSIDYETLERFDVDLTDNYRSEPGQMREYAEKALRLTDLPTTTSLVAIRTKHLHQLIQVLARSHARRPFVPSLLISRMNASVWYLHAYPTTHRSKEFRPTGTSH